jgi:hypothetical protein
MEPQRKFCEACGSQLVPLAEFCASCGQNVGLPPPPAPQVQPAVPCPKCRQSDLTYTAPDFIRLDFSKIQVSKDEWDPASTQEFLAKPERPELPALGFWIVVPFIPIANVLLIWFAPLHKSYKFVLLAMAAIFAFCIATQSLYEMGAYAFVGIAMLIVYFGGLIVDRGRQKAELEQKRIPEWNRSLPIWEQVRYCRRCDLAWLGYDPSRQAPPEDLKKLLRMG